MKKKLKKIIIISIIFLLISGLAVALFTIFFDQAVLVRKGTIYHIQGSKKIIALTFDDGPSPVWTPKILAELEKAGVKATFFMTGKYVLKYPEIAQSVASQGHEIANHSFNHNVLIYYKMNELEKEIKDTEAVIKKVTGITTCYFRPPKAWLTNQEKRKIEEMGYQIILWSLNSKDWVTFDDKYMLRYLVRRVRPGDIILFHDSGGFFSTEGGDRHETVLCIPRLVEKLRERGYEFMTLSELLSNKKDNNVQE